MPIQIPPDILTGAGAVLSALLARKRTKDGDAQAPEGPLADVENGDVIKVDRGRAVGCVILGNNAQS